LRDFVILRGAADCSEARGPFSFLAFFVTFVYGLAVGAAVSASSGVSFARFGDLALLGGCWAMPSSLCSATASETALRFLPARLEGEAAGVTWGPEGAPMVGYGFDMFKEKIVTAVCLKKGESPDDVRC
jgi:hypothetical protein